VNVWAGAKEVTAEEDEPFLKTATPDAENTKTEEATPSAEKKEEPAQMELGWNVTPVADTGANTTAHVSNEAQKENEVKRYTLEDDMEEMNLDTANTKRVLSPEEQQQRSQERMSKIQEYTQRLKKTDGIQDLEKEPAYVRRNVQLDDSIPSEESNQSRFSISKNNDGTSLNSNNSFLHDNVD